MRHTSSSGTRLRRASLALGALAVAASLVAVAPRGVGAAIPDVVLTLSVKPSWIEFGGTFTLTATVTPSKPVTGLLRVGIFAENALPAYGHMHGCTPACSLEYPGLAEFEFDGLDAKATIKAMWTDDGHEQPRNRFNVGVTGGDVNYMAHDWVTGYIGGPPPTATPKPTRRPTPVPTARPATAPPPSPTAIASPAPASSSGLESPIATPSSPSATAPPGTAPPAATAGSLPSPSSGPVVEPTASSSPGVGPILALVAIIALFGAGLFAMRRRRASPG